MLSPAKVNLWLRVLGVRDDGLHELDTGFAFVDFGDAMCFRLREDRAIEVNCSLPGLAGKNNLVYRVLCAFAEEVGARRGLAVHIDKHIPLQAGLGGGSSNAATALLLANAWWQVHWPRARLIEWAAKFGADIPCFLFGRAARGHGIGERLVEIPAPSGWLCLAMPQGGGLSTAQVFAAFDECCAQTESALNEDARTDSLPALGENALEPAARALSPAMAKLLDAMRAEGAKAWMTGSGACCVAWYAARKDAERMAALLQARGLAGWVQVSRLQVRHPLCDWGVAKR